MAKGLDNPWVRKSTRCPLYRNSFGSYRCDSTKAAGALVCVFCHRNGVGPEAMDQIEAREIKLRQEYAMRPRSHKKRPARKKRVYIPH
jgi:hypothetical protein